MYVVCVYVRAHMRKVYCVVINIYYLLIALFPADYVIGNKLFTCANKYVVQKRGKVESINVFIYVAN